MKLNVLIASAIFAWVLLPGLSNAQNKVVVIPLIDTTLAPETIRHVCRSYEAVGKTLPASLDCPPKMVFVSSAKFKGFSVGGVSGADEKCQTLADASDLTKGRSFKAWISDDTHSPGEEFIHSQTPYVLVGGGTVANDWTELTSGLIQTQIDNTEFGITHVKYPAAVTDGVWTGTTASASTYAGDDCGEWGADLNANDGVFGKPTATNSHWTDAGQLSGGCDSEYNQFPIYCFEQ